MVMAWFELRNISWMHKNPSDVLMELLRNYYRRAWSSVVLMKHNSSPACQSFVLLGDYFFLAVKLLRLKVRFKSLTAGE